MVKYDSVLLFSGGLDSTTLLYKLLDEGKEVLCVGFDYSQKHISELTKASSICSKEGVAYITVTLPPLVRDDDGGSMIVSHRNLLFLTMGHYYATMYKAKEVVIGVCEGDEGGFPDCREGFIALSQKVLDIGYGKGITLSAPLLHLSKVETLQMADNLGKLKEVLENTLTCYNGDMTKLHKWGYGCGQCMSCKGREVGYTDFILNKGGK